MERSYKRTTLTLVAGISCIGVAYLFATESFVVKRKQRNQSTHVLKEQVCQLVGHLLREDAALRVEIARFDVSAANCITDALDNGGETSITKADKEQLKALTETIKLAITETRELRNSYRELIKKIQ